MIKIHGCVAYGHTVKTERNVSQVAWRWLLQLLISTLASNFKYWRHHIKDLWQVTLRLNI